jgi:hypothetical protein
MMLLGLGITGVSWRIGGRKCSEGFADCDADGFGRARGGLALQVLELGEDLFDQVQVRPYFGKKKSLAPAARMRWHSFVATEIVHDHDVAGAKRGGPSRHRS